MTDDVSVPDLVRTIAHQLLDVIVVLEGDDRPMRVASTHLAVEGIVDLSTPIRSEASEREAYALIAPVVIAATTLLDGLTTLLARQFGVDRIDTIPLLREYLDERIDNMASSFDEES